MSDLTAHDTGLDLERLRGQDNYNTWCRDFQLLAELKGVWELYVGEDVILTKPNRAQYHIKPLATVSEDQEMIDKPDKDTPALIAQYRLELEEYERNHKRVRLARALLPYWVDPSIRGQIIKIDSPKTMWDHLKSQYKMHGSRALDLALDKYENCTLDQCQEIQIYINRLTGLRQDVKEAGGEIGEAQFISKLIRGLTDKFQPFIDQYYFLQGTIGFTNNSIHDITSRLLTFESKINHASDRTVFAAYNKDNAANKSKNKSYHGQGRSNGGRDNKIKCTHCDKWHSGICFKKFPEVKTELDRLKAAKEKTDGKPEKKYEDNENKGRPAERRKLAASIIADRDEFLQKLTQARKDEPTKITTAPMFHLNSHSSDWPSDEESTENLTQNDGWVTKPKKTIKINVTTTTNHIATHNKFALLNVEEPSISSQNPEPTMIHSSSTSTLILPSTPIPTAADTLIQVPKAD
ncbi:hypothetical protein M8818_007404 [Zalaria obscura]|uniref:Uncharacterized protein n=1 Tax=Zalaria obscura TaxID=2024903 RepID=A0ACC3S363_9PEZI